MADCFPPESDDLHRRWLPREIFADIGIVDTETVAAAAAAAVVVAEPTPEAAAAAAVEELAAQLAGILGGGAKVWPLATPPPHQAPPVVAAAAPRHGAQVCGLEGSVVVSTNGGGAVSWPFVPYPQLQWQVGSSLVNHGGVLDYPVLDYPPALPCHVPPPANLRSGGGTGVFLPRVEAYRYATTPPATAKGGAAGAATKPWAAGTGGRPATGKKHEWQAPQTEQATQTKQLQHQKQQQQATGAAQALALPQDWSYR